MTGIITKFIKYLSKAVSFLFPDVLFNADIFTNFNKYLDILIDFLADINFLIPLPDIFIAFGIMVSITTVKFTLFIMNWIIKRTCEVIP